MSRAAPARALDRDPEGFIRRFLPLNEKGEPWKLAPYQRRLLRHAFRWQRKRLQTKLLLDCEMKKAGKTTLGAALIVWWAYTRAFTEVIIAANTREQARNRLFDTAVALIEHNADLAASATMERERILLSNGTKIIVVPANYRAVAGSRHSLAAFDELWGYMREDLDRLFEELTPPPTEPDAWTLIATTAGWSGESALLERLRERGLAGEPVADDLLNGELWRDREYLMFWSHTPRQPWQDAAYYAQQRRLLRPSQFARLHENKMVAADEEFITATLLDAATDDGLRPLLPGPTPGLILGVDASTKHDLTALAGVYREGNSLNLGLTRLWKPDPEAPEAKHLLDLEAEIVRLCRQYRVLRIVADPYQLAGMIARLRAQGIPIVEFPQTAPNLEEMGKTLYNVLKQRVLRLYPDATLRAQLLGAHVEHWKIRKKTASKKVDLVIALAMATQSLVEFWPMTDFVDLTITAVTARGLDRFASREAHDEGVAAQWAGYVPQNATRELLLAFIEEEWAPYLAEDDPGDVAAIKEEAGGVDWLVTLADRMVTQGRLGVHPAENLTRALLSAADRSPDFHRWLRNRGEAPAHFSDTDMIDTRTGRPIASAPPPGPDTPAEIEIIKRCEAGGLRFWKEKQQED